MFLSTFLCKCSCRDMSTSGKRKKYPYSFIHLFHHVFQSMYLSLSLSPHLLSQQCAQVIGTESLRHPLRSSWEHTLDAAFGGAICTFMTFLWKSTLRAAMIKQLVTANFVFERFAQTIQAPAEKLHGILCVGLREWAERNITHLLTIEFSAFTLNPRNIFPFPHPFSAVHH